jgi:hypothetical protein
MAGRGQPHFTRRVTMVRFKITTTRKIDHSTLAIVHLSKRRRRVERNILFNLSDSNGFSMAIRNPDVLTEMLANCSTLVAEWPT